MKPSLRMLLRISLVAVGAILVCLIIANWHAEEPHYQGKALSTWMDQLMVSPQNLSEDAALVADRQRLEMFTNAVRSIGTNGLPFYLGWIHNPPRASSRYEKFKDWLVQISSSRVRLPERKNRVREAFLAIQILGPSAKSAISPLERLLNNESSCDVAARCLAAIGPDSVFVLSNALASTNDRVRNAAARGLGGLGTAARQARPALLELLQKEVPSSFPGLSTADLVVRALAEMNRDSDELLPLLSEQLFATNAAAGAAYGLVRFEAAGTPFLTQALTNQDLRIRASAEAAFDLKIYLVTNQQTDPASAFNHFNTKFNYTLLRVSATKGREPQADLENQAK